MKQNCKRACASAGDLKVAGAAAEKTAEECAGWAARGYCHNPEYAPFMTQNCASICRNMPEITFKEELPPPVDVWTIFLIVGFGAAARLAETEMSERRARWQRQRSRLEGWICAELADTLVQGDLDNRLPNTSSLAITGLKAEALVMPVSSVALNLPEIEKRDVSPPSVGLIAP